jgi:hypothetical protein
MKKKKAAPHDKVVVSGRRKLTEYRPTVAEQRVMEVLLNPDNRLKSVTEICQLANCSRQTYYNYFDKPEFVTYYINKSKALIKKAHAGIINSCIRQALRGDSAHAKLLLTMTGDYADRQVFPDKDGKPQPIAGEVTIIPPLERSTRVAYLLGLGIERKKKAEKADDGKKQG